MIVGEFSMCEICLKLEFYVLLSNKF